MTLVVSNIVSLTTAIFLSLSQWYGDGVASYQKKEYKAAAKSFTRVVEEKVQPNPFFAQSLYMRAQCFIKLDNKDKAVADLRQLLESESEGDLDTLAAGDFKKLTGKDWDGLNLSTPEKTWASFIAALQRRDINAVRACCQGKLLQELNQQLTRGEDKFWEEAKEITGARITSVRYNKDRSKALIRFAIPDMGDPFADEGGPQLIMSLANKRWQLSDEGNSRRDREEFADSKEEPPKVPDAEKATEKETALIRDLISQLGAHDFETRQTAYQKLKDFGDKAKPFLEKAVAVPDPEIAIRARQLLNEL
jgi:tetratricopeptide (TPR) repeat protein